jgi:DNA-directed RNA polymerase subunit H
MPSAAATAVSMDVEKLYRCQQFFLHQLLPDRQCTFDVLEYQTSMDKFTQYYHAVSKEKPSSLADRFQIVGTMPVRRAAYRFASTRTNGQADYITRTPTGEPGSTPLVPPHAWAPAVKKAADRATADHIGSPSESEVLVAGAKTGAETGAKGGLKTGAKGGLKTGAKGGLKTGAKGGAKGGAKTAAKAGAKARAKATTGKKASAGEGQDGVEGSEAVPLQPLKWRKGVAQVPFAVHFLPNSGDASFGKPAAAQLVSLLRARGIQWLFLVSVGGITTYAARELATWCCFEVWPLLSCLCPAVTHQAFPPHRLLSPEEKKAFYDEWKVTPAQVSRMQVTDAAAKYYGYVPGDVVAIRRNTFVGFLDAFRVVVHVPV